MKFTNDQNLPLSIAVMLAHDEYPEHREGVISVTTLLKPIQEIILTMQLKKSVGYEDKEDVGSRINSALGTAYHNHLEKAWTSPLLPKTLEALGYPPGLVNNIVVNPEDPDDDGIHVYTEFRTEKEFKGWTISGEFDFLADGRLRDCKSTGTYTWIKQTNAEKYKLQLSMYRWLNPEKVTDDVAAIDYLFTDWSGLAARTQKDYPPTKIMEQLFELYPIDYIERYVSDKLALIDKLRYANPDELPSCTEEDLWIDPPKYKYFKKEDAKRATRVCESMAEALEIQRQAGGVGFIVEHKGEVKACRYCKGRPLCKQAERYLLTGELKLG